MQTPPPDTDPEKGFELKSQESPSADSPEWNSNVQVQDHREPWSRRFIDSFKRDPNAHIIKPGQSLEGDDGRAFDHKAAAERTANSGLAHKLKGRHLQMIAIGGSIGEPSLSSPRWTCRLTTGQVLASL